MPSQNEQLAIDFIANLLYHESRPGPIWVRWGVLDKQIQTEFRQKARTAILEWRDDEQSAKAFRELVDITGGGEGDIKE